MATLNCGTVVEFTPPYAHLLTPLDNGAFGFVVRYLQRHHRVLGRAVMAGDVRAALDDAFLNAVSEGGALQCMGWCGYEWPFKCPY